MKDEKAALRTVIKQLRKIVGATPTLVTATGLGRVFELYVWVRLAGALKHLGWNVQILQSDGSPLPPHGTFRQRGGKPSGIDPASFGSFGPSTIRIEKNGKVWEIWNGVQFRGRSKALHEIDIAVVPHELAAQIRAGTMIGFAFGRPKVAIECKDVGNAASPDEMRAFIARLYDLTILYGHHRYLFGGKKAGEIFDSVLGVNAYGKTPRTFRIANDQTFNVVARRSGFSWGAVAMTELFRIDPYSKVDHPSPEADRLIQDVANWIDLRL